MILSDKHRFVFIHIPKTGGSSVTWNLRKEINNLRGVDIDSVQPKKGWQGLFHVNGQHSGYLENEAFFREQRGYYSFCFVRNPWSLAFSWFMALSRSSTTTITPENFKKFLFSPPASHAGLMNRLQTSYICNREGLIMMNYVAHYEQFDSEFDTLIKRLEIPGCENERQNVANPNRLDYQDFYDIEGRDFIAHRYQLDIQNFSYKFE